MFVFQTGAHYLERLIHRMYIFYLQTLIRKIFESKANIILFKISNLLSEL